MSSKERRAENEAAYQAEYEARERREHEYTQRWAPLYASLEKVGIDPYELRTWVEEITRDES